MTTPPTNPTAAAAAERAANSLELQRAFQRDYLADRRAAVARRLARIAELARVGRPPARPYRPNIRRAEQARSR